MTLRGRLTALAVGVVLLSSTALVVLVRSHTPGCTVLAPRPSLPPQLRAVGDFDQTYDVSNSPALEDAAGRAASSLHGDLIGAVPEQPIRVAATEATSSDAVVVPLRGHTTAQGVTPLAGLVVFLQDCQGNAYFASVEDDASAQQAPSQFPTVSQGQASARLGTAAIRLVYVSDPLRPEWVTTSSPPQSLLAR
ncbi:MAG: hypothetical protein JF887_08695 [Candidatus Dormibacteraeota bacterium]|uniref:Uncharacterized protein n=1 Tax=Candidatus Amunia macphersoniae TaxID=3127014 RepID=A0A934KHD6_9BACT|nr:hypothetical protein [Candidatus Dormibacteraeota bacterium]